MLVQAKTANECLKCVEDGQEFILNTRAELEHFETTVFKINKHIITRDRESPVGSAFLVEYLNVVHFSIGHKECVFTDEGFFVRCNNLNVKSGLIFIESEPFYSEI